MKILSIDTASNICSVALLENGNIIKELNIDNEKTHSEKLMPLVKEIFEVTHTKLEHINLIACDKGPGSFTGIRIGVSSAKAIAQVLDIPTLGISSLDGLAYNLELINGTICSLIDARNNQVYCGIFDNEYNLLKDYIADDINIAIEHLKKYKNITFVGNGAIIHKTLLQSNLNNIHFSNKNNLSSYNIGRCAYKKYLEGEKENADTLLPLYLRKSQAERMKDLNGSHND